MIKKFSFVLLILLLVSSPALAVLPDANVVDKQFEIGVAAPYFGNFAVGVEYGLNDSVGIGFGYWSFFNLLGAIGEALTDEDFEDYIGVYDVHLNWQVAGEDEGGPCNVSLLIGAQMISFPEAEPSQLAGAEAGFCLSKKLIEDWLIGRLNLVGSFYADAFWLGSPTGLELGIRPTENIELSIGIGVHLLGIKVMF